MLDKTITSALLNLRAQIIRGKLDGLEHVEALLVARGVDPAALHVPQQIAQRRDTSRLALNALRDGPKRAKEVAQHVMAATGMPERQAKAIMYQAVYNLHRRGLVVKNGRVWGLAPTSHLRTN
jgi:glycerol-3-phosphate dehydrogenase